MVPERWKKALIHLECATDPEHRHDRDKRIDQETARLKNGEITPVQFADRVLSGSIRDLRYHGTALLVVHAGRRYLLTARHVVFDERTAAHELKEEVRKSESYPDDVRRHILEIEVERAKNRIFDIIFRVPSLDENLAGQGMPAFLMNIGATRSGYIFSEPEIDLALISIHQEKRFVDELDALGYVPIPSGDISDGPDFEGQEVFAVGFPSSTALLGRVNQHPAIANLASARYSLPVAAFGRVSMLHQALPFFWSDLSIYPGNSGGPVVCGDRLVGVVSGQATLPIDEVPEVRTRIPFGKIIKSSHVRSLLAAQVEQESCWNQPEGTPEGN